MRSLILASLILPTLALAQSVDVKDVDGSDEGTTTIQIRKSKGDDKETALGKAIWEITEGSSDLEGEPAPGEKDARQNWKTACDDWKKEFRADNKENKIINISCGTATCAGEAAKKICSSKATYKIKTRMD